MNFHLSVNITTNFESSYQLKKMNPPIGNLVLRIQNQPIFASEKHKPSFSALPAVDNLFPLNHDHDSARVRLIAMFKKKKSLQ